MGGQLEIVFASTKLGRQTQAEMVDFCAHYVKAKGQLRAQVFKSKSMELAPGQSMTLRKTLSLQERSNRKHYLGTHRADLILNGQRQGTGRV